MIVFVRKRRLFLTLNAICILCFFFIFIYFFFSQRNLFKFLHEKLSMVRKRLFSDSRITQNSNHLYEFIFAMYK